MYYQSIRTLLPVDICWYLKANSRVRNITRDRQITIFCNLSSYRLNQPLGQAVIAAHYNLQRSHSLPNSIFILSM